LHLQDVIDADGWWHWARRAGLPAQTTRWDLRMARGIHDPALDAVVVIRFDPSCMQSGGHIRRLGAGHLAAGRANKARDLPLVLGVMGWGIIHRQWDHSPDATQRTARTLAAVVAYALPWDALGEPGSLEDFNHLSDRLALRQPAGDARAGMVVKDRNQRAITAVSLGGRERTDIHRP